MLIYSLEVIEEGKCVIMRTRLAISVVSRENFLGKFPKKGNFPETFPQKFPMEKIKLFDI